LLLLSFNVILLKSRFENWNAVTSNRPEADMTQSTWPTCILTLVGSTSLGLCCSMLQNKLGHYPWQSISLQNSKFCGFLFVPSLFASKLVVCLQGSWINVYSRVFFLSVNYFSSVTFLWFSSLEVMINIEVVISYYLTPHVSKENTCRNK
jgi:hypothetical protein